MFFKRFLPFVLSLGLIATAAFACDDDNDNFDDHCKNKQDGADCGEKISWCFCYQGKAIHADEIMCQEFPCSESCKEKKTGESCGDGMICDPGGSCIEPKPYK